MILTCKCGRDFERNGRYGRISTQCPPCRVQHKRDYNREYARTRYADLRQAIPKVNGERPSSPTPEFEAPNMDVTRYWVDLPVKQVIHYFCKDIPIPGPVHVYTPAEVREYETQNGLV